MLSTAILLLRLWVKPIAPLPWNWKTAVMRAAA